MRARSQTGVPGLLLSLSLSQRGCGIRTRKWHFSGVSFVTAHAWDVPEPSTPE